MHDAADITTKIRAILRDHGRLAQGIEGLGDDGDLYAAGMTSHASVNVMLTLEGTFEVEFPDSMLKKSVFQSIGSMRDAIQQLLARR
jgi:acyl carrier protein